MNKNQNIKAKPFPIGIQSFEMIIQENYLYIDKTQYIYNLISTGSRYFLSRPRRFGKSLFVSTLASIFQGKKDLFQDLWISKSDYDWKEYFVIQLDFGIITVGNAEELKTVINRVLDSIAAEHNIVLQTEMYHSKFYELIAACHKKYGKVVVLIDEYDKPILDNISDIKKAVEIRDILKGLYTVLKGSDEYLKFVLLTGVSKFAKASVFSGLNNLNDITTHHRYSAMLGYTQEELNIYFKKNIFQLADDHHVSEAEILQKTKQWYNGYRFSTKEILVYNPFSILLLFNSGEFKPYWFETGTPTFLINLIKENLVDLQELDQLEVEKIGFDTYEIDDLRPVPLLFQTGYLTITGYDDESMVYTLDYPNFEVKNSFLQYLIDAYSGIRKETAGSYLNKLIKAISTKNFETFFETMRCFFANIPYDLHLKHEKYYQSIFYLIFSLLGLRTKAEVKTNVGRIDTVIETEKNVFIFEFKLFGKKENALQQIKEKKYYEPYLNLSKEIILCGVEFSSKTKNIDDWVVEPVIQVKN